MKDDAIARASFEKRRRRHLTNALNEDKYKNERKYKVKKEGWVVLSSSSSSSSSSSLSF